MLGGNFMNNIKLIREIYGATQEQVAQAIGVNRVTVAKWEVGTAFASSSKRERMSMYFGIGPEYFYDKEVTEEIKKMLVDTADKAKEVISMSGGKRNKEADYNKLFSSTSFEDAMKKYMFAMKMMLASADNGDLETLKTASLINTKMGARLQAIIEIREQESSNGEPSLTELMEKLEDKNSVDSH